jgi:hypothetical protein
MLQALKQGHTCRTNAGSSRLTNTVAPQFMVFAMAYGGHHVLAVCWPGGVFERTGQMPDFIKRPLLIPLIFMLETCLPATAQTLEPAENLDQLERNAETLRRLRDASSASKFLQISPAAGQIKTHTSLGELMRISKGVIPGDETRKGEPLFWISAELEGLDGSSLTERSARMTFYRDTPVNSSVSLGLQYMVDWQSDPTLDTKTSHIGSTLAPYASLKLIPGLSLKSMAGLAFDNGQTPLDKSQNDPPFPESGILLASQIVGAKSWHGISLTPDTGFLVVSNGTNSRTQFFLQPKISYRFEHSSGIVVTPHAAFKGSWSETVTDETTNSLTDFAFDKLDAHAELGLKLDIDKGVELNLLAPSLNFDEPGKTEFSGTFKYKLPFN